MKIETVVTIKLIAVGFVVVLIFAWIYRSCSVGMGHEYTITGTVTDKGIKRVNNEDIYLVYCTTSDGVEVMQITDSLWALRYNSSDVYAGIQEGVKYRFKVRGSRNRLMSWYPNIYEYTEVSE